jgi:hypothetical protein
MISLNEFNLEEFTGFVEVLSFFANLPSPEEVLEFRPSPPLQAQIDHLSQKCQDRSLTATEEKFWHQYQYLEHIIRVAKTNAYLRLHNTRE